MWELESAQVLKSESVLVLALHWAVVAVAAGKHEDGVTAADVKAVCGLDPPALCRHHLKFARDYPYEVSLHNPDCGFTPAHLLCMLETTERTKALVRYISTTRPQSFTMDVSYRHWIPDPFDTDPFGALHVACRYGQPTEWLVQQLLQLDSSACSAGPKIEVNIRESPLGFLCHYSSHVDRPTAARRWCSTASEGASPRR